METNISSAKNFQSRLISEKDTSYAVNVIKLPILAEPSKSVRVFEKYRKISRTPNENKEDFQPRLVYKNDAVFAAKAMKLSWSEPSKSAPLSSEIPKNSKTQIVKRGKFQPRLIHKTDALFASKALELSSLAKSSKSAPLSLKTQRKSGKQIGNKEQQNDSVTEIARKTSKNQVENKSSLNSSSRPRLKVNFLKSRRAKYCQNKVGNGDITLTFEYQGLKFGAIYAKDLRESKAIVDLTKLKIKERKFRNRYAIKTFGLVL